MGRGFSCLTTRTSAPKHGAPIARSVALTPGRTHHRSRVGDPASGKESVAINEAEGGTRRSHLQSPIASIPMTADRPMNGPKRATRGGEALSPSDPNIEPRPQTPTGRKRAVVGLALAAMALAPVTAGCDATATIFKLRISLTQDGIQPLGAWPARQVAGTNQWERVCGPGGQIDGVITDISLISTTRQSSLDQDSDKERDLQIQPGDIVEFLRVDGPSSQDIQLSGTTNMAVEFSCIDPQPGTSECNGAQPSASVENVSYDSNTLDRETGHNVLVLIDQSGSVGGLVDNTRGNIETGQTFVPPSNFGQLSSDRLNLRLSAAKTMLELMDDEDRFGALAFSEDTGIKIPCDGATGDASADLDTCFGARNTDIWKAQATGIDSLAGKTGERSNLWNAVSFAYEFLKARNDRARTNHIVVITDGPDTCSRSENINGCETPCTRVDYNTPGATTATKSSYEDFLEVAEADLESPNGIKIHVHFMQFESLGYPGRDPRQWELACISGAQYQYVNTNTFPRDTAEATEAAFFRTINNLRSAFQGHWEVAGQMPAFTEPNPGSGTPPGSMYGIEGVVRLKTGANLTSNEVVVPFGFGNGPGASQSAQWDRRLTIRKSCAAATDCGAAGDAGAACTVICSDETHTCPAGAAGEALPDTAACTLDTGAGGFCCSGACQPVGGQCAACVQ